MGGALGTPAVKQAMAVKPRLVCIEGNVAAGKSTSLELLRSMGYTVFTEPIDSAWAPLFTLRHQDPERWAFTFQVQVMCTLHKQMQQACALAGPFKGDVIFFERSPKAALAFANIAHTEGHLNFTELKLLKELFAEMRVDPDMYIYLKSTPELCLQRVTNRGRSGEQGLKLADLKTIEAAMRAADLAATSVDATGPPNATVVRILQTALAK